MAVLAEAGVGITVLFNDTSNTGEYEKTPVVSAGDFLRIDGDLYEVATGGANEKYNITLTEPYSGAGGDGKTILTAYYGSLPDQCVWYNSTANKMQNYIHNNLFNVPFEETIKVSSENITDGSVAHHLHGRCVPRRCLLAGWSTASARTSRTSAATSRRTAA